MENNILNGENSENLNQENSSFFDEKVSSSNSNEGYPQLRFKEYKKPYTTFKLSDFTDRITRKNSKNETELSLTISSKDGLIAQEHFFNKLVSSKDLSGYYLLKKGEFAYNKSYSVGFDFGSIKRLELYDKGALSTLYICFGVKGFKPEYIRHYFDSLKWYKEIYLIAAEGARNHGLLNVPTEQFFETKHMLTTDLIEQQKIADFLSLVDKRIEKQRLLVENLKKYKRGLLSAIFERKIYFDKYDSWNEYLLSKILNERKTYCEKDGTYEHATLSKEGVSGKTERYERDFLVSTENKKYKITHWGDICYNPANLKFGVICLNTYGSAIFSPIYVTFEISENLNKEFIGHCLTRNEFVRKALKYQQGTVYERMAVSPEDLLSMSISLPNIKTQNKIAKMLSLYDKKINIEETCLNKFVTLKKSLLQQMFI